MDDEKWTAEVRAVEAWIHDEAGKVIEVIDFKRVGDPADTVTIKWTANGIATIG